MPRPHFTLGKEPVPTVQDAVLSPSAGLYIYGNLAPSPGFDPRTIQPVASRYAGWATAAHIVIKLDEFCKKEKPKFFRYILHFLSYFQCKVALQVVYDSKSSVTNCTQRSSKDFGCPPSCYQSTIRWRWPKFGTKSELNFVKIRQFI